MQKNKKEKRILYLITRENVLESGALKSQVFELLGKIISKDNETSILVLNFPSLNRFVRDIGKYQSVKKYVNSLGINLVIIPILPFGRSIMPVWAIPFLLIQTIPFVLFFSWKEKINIFHSRAYLSSIILYFIKKFILKIDFIFDARGPYLLEGETYGKWESSNDNYKFWAKLEKKLFKNAKYVIAQSVGFTKYVKKILPEANVVNIPCCADVDNYNFTEKEIIKEKRNMNIQNKFVVVYSGSLGSFHDPEFLVKAYVSIRESLPNPHFLVVTHSVSDEILESLAKNGINKSEFTIVLSPDNLPKYIALGDIGLHVMNDLPITPLVISVKFSEYLAAGLPVIISKNMTSLTKIVETSSCGIVLDEKKQEMNKNKIEYLVKNYSEYRKNALELVNKDYSTDVVARRYSEIYDSFK